MKNNLTTTKSTNLILKKSKSMLNITNRILSGKTSLTQIDESWIERLWAWADENEISDVEWIEHVNHFGGRYEGHYEGHYEGFPRDKKILLESTELNLCYNQLTELPKEIGNLSNLRELNLCYNQLTELPKEIGNLSNLRELNLRDNQLVELPKEIENLSNLREFDLGSNYLTKLPEEIKNLTNLISLNLEYNQLKELPTKIGNLGHLNGLHLGGNQYDIQIYKNLKIIRAQRASEKNIPECIVFSDRTLKDMSAKLPQNKEEMLDVYGLCETKFERYGEIFLETLQSN